MSRAQRIARAAQQLDADRRNALGPLRQGSSSIDADRERAGRLAADNLLQKALRRVASGDDAGARRFVERALTHGIDGGEPGEAGAMGSHLLAWDVLRTAAIDDPDASWLVRANAIAGTLEGPARVEWLRALDAVTEDVHEEVGARVDAVSGAAGLAARDPLDGVDALPDRVDVVVGLLGAVLAFERG